MTAIVCVSKSWGIGRDGALLFLISDDHKRFRSLTVGKTVILGIRPEHLHDEADFVAAHPKQTVTAEIKVYDS